MPFPESPRVIYGQNPLDEVICQLRFPAVLRIVTDQPADFQDKIRREYPLYSLHEPSIELPQLPKELSSVIEQIGLSKPAGAATHKFYTKDSQRFISLAQDFLALTEFQYVRWESYREELEKAERALREVYSPAFYTRVGLRYRDVISRHKLGLTDKKWKDLLQPHIVAELGALEESDAVVTTRTRSIIKTPEVPGGQAKLTHGLVAPPDREEECYVIDVDFSVEQREGLSGTLEILEKFNRLAGRLFRWAITDTLHQAMEPKTI